MLTHNDYTLENAGEILDDCIRSKAEYCGMKEAPLAPKQMKILYDRLREGGKKTVLEVVGYSEQEGLNGARLAADCGCDILMGTTFSHNIARFCRDQNIRYMPFVGEVSGRPSVLTGSIEGMVSDARDLIEAGVFGIDILGYRFTGDACALNRALVEQTGGNICVAGSIDSFDRLDEIKAISPWGFTIGGAFFENRFGDDLASQINRVVDYLSI